MRGYIHAQTGERLSWYDLKKRLNASIPFLCPSVGEWELEPEPEPVMPPKKAEPEPDPVEALAQRVEALEKRIAALETQKK